MITRKRISGNPAADKDFLKDFLKVMQRALLLQSRSNRSTVSRIAGSAAAAASHYSGQFATVDL